VALKILGVVYLKGKLEELLGFSGEICERRTGCIDGIIEIIKRHYIGLDSQCDS
jgi:hypothetical protein